MGFVKDKFFGGEEEAAGKRIAEANRQASEQLLAAGERGSTLIGEGFAGAEGDIAAGLTGAEGALFGGFAGSEAGLAQGLSGAQFGLTAGFRGAEDALTPFTTRGGSSALDKQAALSGALGPDAQRQAFAEFEESPGVQFAREQGLRLVDSGSAATGAGGGERLRELTRFSQGLALQDLSEQFNRLGTVAAGDERVTNRQQAAGTNVANLRAGFGRDIAQTSSDFGRDTANLRTGFGSNVANIRSAAGNRLGGLRLDTAAQQADLLARAAGGSAGNIVGGASARAAGDVAGSAGLRAGATQIAGGAVGATGGGGLTGFTEGFFGV